jgi:hypothetical protein
MSFKCDENNIVLHPPQTLHQGGSVDLPVPLPLPWENLASWPNWWSLAAGDNTAWCALCGGVLIHAPPPGAVAVRVAFLGGARST